MRLLLNACIMLLIVNIGSLFFLYGVGTTGEDKESAQRLSKLISSYAEPDSNPQSLINAENQCRFWDKSYCARAEAKRKAVAWTYPALPSVPQHMKSTALYSAYVETRAALNEASTNYVTFLSTNPPDAIYVDRSKEFEEQVNVLLGKMVSYLYDMQEQVSRKQDKQAELILMGQYFCSMLLLLLVCILRFRRGGVGYGQY